MSKINKIIFISLLSLVLVFSLSVVPAFAEQRIALIMGNADYPEVADNHLFGALPTPRNDAEDVAEMLQHYNFEVNLVTDATRELMYKAIDAFIEKLQSGGVGFFYYAGHGVQVEKNNYLLPVGRTFSDASDVKYYAVNANWILEKMAIRNDANKAKLGINIMILDANREFSQANPQKWRVDGLTEMKAKEAIISYAASPDGTVLESETERNSLYTQYLLNAMKAGGIIEQMLEKTRIAVSKATNYQQIPWYDNTLSTDLMRSLCLGECAKKSPLLGKCESALKKNQVMETLTCYQQGFKKERNHAKALGGLEKMITHLTTLTEIAIKKGQLDKVQLYFGNVLMVQKTRQDIINDEYRQHRLALQLENCEILLTTNEEEKSQQCYQQVLDEEPNSEKAKAGLEKIAVLQQHRLQIADQFYECEKHLMKEDEKAAVTCYQQMREKYPTNTTVKNEALVGLENIHAHCLNNMQAKLRMKELYKMAQYSEVCLDNGDVVTLITDWQEQLAKTEGDSDEEQVQPVEVSQLLVECEYHLKVKRLTTTKSPGGRTALECYLDVLKKEPAHAEALAGITKIGALYESWNNQEKLQIINKVLKAVSPNSLILEEKNKEGVAQALP
jgi:hypothetical protein